MRAKMTGSRMIHIFLKMVATGLSWPQPDLRHSMEATKARMMVARPPAPVHTRFRCQARSWDCFMIVFTDVVTRFLFDVFYHYVHTCSGLGNVFIIIINEDQVLALSSLRSCFKARSWYWIYYNCCYRSDLDIVYIANILEARSKYFLWQLNIIVQGKFLV